MHDSGVEDANEARCTPCQHPLSLLDSVIIIPNNQVSWVNTVRWSSNLAALSSSNPSWRNKAQSPYHLTLHDPEQARKTFTKKRRLCIGFLGLRLRLKNMTCLYCTAVLDTIASEVLTSDLNRLTSLHNGSIKTDRTDWAW